MRADYAIEHLQRTRIIAILRGDLSESGARVVEVLVQAGITAIEVSTVTPCFADNLSLLAETFAGQAAIGAGTVLTIDHLKAAADAGATFIVSPNTNPTIIERTRMLGLASFPGAYTPTEIVQAADCGAHAIKLFPASGLGPGYLRALHGPFPDWKFIPTGGIQLEDMEKYLRGGAFALGIGSELVGRAELENLSVVQFSEKAKAFAARAREFPYGS